MTQYQKTILLIGSGPIVIGQAAEFDYSGTQAAKVLRKEGYRVVLVNSNPATIMTDPELADATYIEPLTVEALEAIIAKERPELLLPTVGGQTALNLSVKLHEIGVLDKYNVTMIGATPKAIYIAEDRLAFRETMLDNDIPLAKGGAASTFEQAEALAADIGYPLLIRSSFSLGGTGASWVHSTEELETAFNKAISVSPVKEAWFEESLRGWKEFELEVMRDKYDNFVVVCSIENLDPMGVHTGDSITVAPAQTLTDREYQVMRDLARQVMTAVGVETGGANVQFAVDPKDGRVIVIEMNPRVSRSSALASKATGFPIAKLAVMVAIGHSLADIPNEITGTTQAAFEPSLDYVVVKIPRWAFEKFPGADPVLGPQMKSVGEVMALGSTFPEALHKAVFSLETGVDALDGSGPNKNVITINNIEEIRIPTIDRLYKVYRSIMDGVDIKLLYDLTGYDPWFLAQLALIANCQREIVSATAFNNVLIKKAKSLGFSDPFIARSLGIPTLELRKLRKMSGIRANFARVDTCAAEFESRTPYLYSAYNVQDESEPSDRRKIMILGSGPNRIGQGIEFDYSCSQAAFALREHNIETIMVNCNPETVSTDYDISDRLYFEPLNYEHVMNVIEIEKPDGVIVQLGGQTPLNLAADLESSGVRVLGTSPGSIALSEDREKFSALCYKLEIDQPEHGIARNIDEARKIAQGIGYPVLIRPSYVLGGRAMAIAGDDEELEKVVNNALNAVDDQALLIDQFLDDSFELDVDALVDEERVVIGAIMEHVEQAGIHSGDSASVIPPYKVSAYHLAIVQDHTRKLGKALNVRGLMNIQFALKDDQVFVIEVNPRASRTVPFVSKATGLPMAKIAAKIMAGISLREQGITKDPVITGFFVKESILPFNKLPGADPRLGPEMRSTGEVMGIAEGFGQAFAKSQQAGGVGLPLSGGVLVSVNNYDKSAALRIARDLHRLGFTIHATPGTAQFFENANLPTQRVDQVRRGTPDVLELIASGKIQMIINTPLGSRTHTDGEEIRAMAIKHNIPLLTTLTAAQAALLGIRSLKQNGLSYISLQELHARNV